MNTQWKLISFTKLFSTLLMMACFMFASQAYAGSFTASTADINDNNDVYHLYIPAGTVVNYTLTIQCDFYCINAGAPTYEYQGGWAYLADVGSGPSPDAGFYIDVNDHRQWQSTTKSGSFITSGEVMGELIVTHKLTQGYASVTLTW